MSEDLLARLRDQAEWYSDGLGPLCKLAADELERLRSELAAARSAALEEAAAHLDWRDAVRYAHYSQAHEAAAAAIRELKI